jgi:hypothetical protein
MGLGPGLGNRVRVRVRVRIRVRVKVRVRVRVRNLGRSSNQLPFPPFSTSEMRRDSLSVSAKAFPGIVTNLPYYYQIYFFIIISSL